MKGLIAWFASNSVVANLLMISIVGAGLMSLVGIPGLSGSSILLEVFPEISVDMVSVSVEYRGAAPVNWRGLPPNATIAARRSTTRWPSTSRLGAIPLSNRCWRGRATRPSW